MQTDTTTPPPATQQGERREDVVVFVEYPDVTTSLHMSRLLHRIAHVALGNNLSRWNGVIGTTRGVILSFVAINPKLACEQIKIEIAILKMLDTAHIATITNGVLRCVSGSADIFGNYNDTLDSFQIDAAVAFQLIARTVESTNRYLTEVNHSK